MNFKHLALIAIAFLLWNCSDENGSVNDLNQNKIALLKVDFTTNTFQGGREFVFNEANDEFTISSDYVAPADFGNIKLYYEPLNEKIFEGTIIWMGEGAMQFPTDMKPASSFQTNDDSFPIPDLDLFEPVTYGQGVEGYYPEIIDYSAIWDSISQLSLVEAYRTANPTSEVRLFLYTPSVGVGDPTEWYWLVFLKN